MPARPNRFRLDNGDLTAAQERGKSIFERVKRKNGQPIEEALQCGTCHSGPKFTNQFRSDVATVKSHDRSGSFDTPQLVNIALWHRTCMTAPRAASKKSGPFSTPMTSTGSPTI